jgi:CheY-like chemotaxis protein
VVDAAMKTPDHLDDSAPQIRRRVLIADDNRDAAETLDMFLRACGHEVHVAH